MKKMVHKLPIHVERAYKQWIHGTIVLILMTGIGLIYTAYRLKIIVNSLENTEKMLGEKVTLARSNCATEVPADMGAYNKRCAKLEKEPFSVVEVLETIESLIPPDIRLKSFNFDHKKQIVLQGQTCSEESFARFVAALRKVYQNLCVEDYRNSLHLDGYNTFSLIIFI